MGGAQKKVQSQLLFNLSRRIGCVHCVYLSNVMSLYISEKSMETMTE